MSYDISIYSKPLQPVRGVYAYFILEDLDILIPVLPNFQYNICFKHSINIFLRCLVDNKYLINSIVKKTV